MNGRSLVAFLVAAFVAWWLWTHRAATSSTTPAGTRTAGVTAAGHDCLSRAEQAAREVQSAAALVGRPPVEASAWSSAETAASSAISAAESACGSGGSDRERQAAEEVRAALSTMRALLADLGNAARGAGGALEAARRQEEIDQRLDRARGLLR